MHGINYVINIYLTKTMPNIKNEKAMILLSFL